LSKKSIVWGLGNILKRKVLQLIGNFNQGGSESQAIQLVRLLQETGRYDIHIGCLEPSGVLRDTVEEFFPGTILEFPLNNFYDVNALRQLNKFQKYLRRNQIEILQTHDFYTNVFGMAAGFLAKVPVRIAARRDTGGIRTATQLKVERYAYRLAHAVVANAASIQSQLAEAGLDEKKIVVIPNAVDLTRFRDGDSGRDQICESLKLPKDAAGFVTIVANMRFAVKDHPSFLRAACIVHESFPRVAFLLAGEGDLRESLLALTRELGLSECVYFLGRCESIAELHAISDVCVLSSTAEGMPNVILEYMAAAKPVVATDVGGVREIVTSGESGFLVQAGDYSSLAEQVKALLRNPEVAVTMGNRGRNVVEKKFSLQAQLNRTEALYLDLLRNANGARSS